MPERCPLSRMPDGAMKFFDDDDGRICQEQCGEAMHQAVTDGPYGDYDLYDLEGHKKRCERAEVADIGYSHSAVHKLEGAERLYAIVDACDWCGEEVGEQTYKFKCPFDSAQ